MKKRVLSLMLATVMCMALAVTANAVEYDSSVLSVEQTSLINGNFPKNVRGETYGTALMAEVVGEMPDLQAAIGTNDQEGYVRTSDLSHPKFETPQQAAKNGWSRNVLVHQIESGLYRRQVLAEKVSNFENRLPSLQSELAVQTMKDPYIFDFIPFKEDMVERDIEQALVKDVTKLLLELGTGFAFLGNQYHLNVGGDDFYIDLLFYNLNLCCYVVVELKIVDFMPEFIGKLNFYVSAADELLRGEGDNPSIGILLCKDKDSSVVEWSLRGITTPLGVASYQLQEVYERTLLEIKQEASENE